MLARQSDEVQSFLVQTSILDQLSGALCDALTGRPGGGQLRAFEDYLKRYKSYDGFISRYSHYVSDWKVTNELLNHSHKLGSVLDFIALNEGVSEDSMYDNCESRSLYDIENFNEAFRVDLKAMIYNRI